MTLLETCLQVTGAFENGTPSYSAMSGNEDGMGMSCGICQWNAGQGTLQTLVHAIGDRMGWDKAQSFFRSNIKAFSSLPPEYAISFCKQHYLIDGDTHMAPDAITAWRSFLSQPESVEIQNAFATDELLNPAMQLAKEFCPENENRTRAVSFFFDVKTQEGSMRTVAPVSIGISADEALAYASQHNQANYQTWLAASSDTFVAQLLYYGYQRALLGNPKYVWDAFSRRATIAARKGIVHGSYLDFTSLLD